MITGTYEDERDGDAFRREGRVRVVEVIDPTINQHPIST